jgi:hypothetical protein
MRGTDDHKGPGIHLLDNFFYMIGANLKTSDKQKDFPLV